MNEERKNISRVLIADDHPIIIERISEILNEYFVIEELLVFTHPTKAIEEIIRKKADLYILDLEFEGMAGFEMINIVRRKDPNSKIIINTMHDQIWTIDHLQQLNVNAIILKATDELPALLIKNAVEKVMEGEIFYSPEIEQLKARIQSYRRNLITKKSIPTETELTVLKYITEGHTSKEIGELLHVSVDAIEQHRKNLFLKLEAKNVAQLVTIAFQNRLVE